MKNKTIAIVLSVVSLVLSACGNASLDTAKDSSVAGTNESYIKLDEASGSIYMYDFGASRNYGDTSFFGDNIDFEGYQGIRLDTSNGLIRFAVYDHLEHTEENITVELYKVSENEEYLGHFDGITIPNGQTDGKWMVVDEELTDGLYRINSKFFCEEKNDYDNVSGYLYINDGEARTCRVSRNKSAASSETLDRILEKSDSDPKKYLSNAKNTYPSDGTGGCCVQIEEWENQADEIINTYGIKDCSDEYKVFKFTTWLANNIAYDEWRVTKNDNKSRATKYNNWKDDQLWAYYNHVGQCWDFANIMAIMCRHVGIPCSDLSNAGHTITCVWMNDRWYAIDITVFTRHTNWDEKPNPDNWKPGEWNYKMSDYYGYFPEDMNAFDECIWEPKNNGLLQKGLSDGILNTTKQHEMIFEPYVMDESDMNISTDMCREFEK